MKRHLAVFSLTVLASFGSSQRLLAQNLIITNARILDGNGGVIERGSIAVRDGRIVSVSASGSAPVPGARTIDAQGRTVMPGFVDAHRHIIQGNPAEWLEKQAPARMQEFLDAGFTSVLSAIDAPQILELRDRLVQGKIAGPRIYAGTMVPINGGFPGGGAPPKGDPARFDPSRPGRRPTRPAPALPADATIKAVEAAAKAGFDYIKTLIITTPGGPEAETLKLVVQEGKKRNLPTITHAVSIEDTLAAVEAGPAVLVHTPHIGRLEDDPAAVKTIAGAGIPMTSTLAVFLPHFDAKNTPLFRDAQPFPWDTISSGGQGPVNARLLWEAGISYGYGTDTSWTPRESLIDELRALSVTFSPKDIVTILTRNAARSMLKAQQVGTLEPGKLGDIVMLDGDPLASSSHLLNVAMTIKGGVVVSDRTPAAAPRR